MSDLSDPTGAAPVQQQDGDAVTVASRAGAVSGWHALHPLTPLIRGWPIVAGGVFFFGQGPGRDVLGGDVPSHTQVLITFGALAALVVAAMVYGWLAWRMTRYRVSPHAVELNTGVLFRQQRQARLDRLQAVDVVQPLLARVVGLAEVKLEVAGGSGSEVKLSYLREPDAQQLRNDLLARAAGISYDEGEQAPEAPEEYLLAVPIDRLVWSVVRSGSFVAALVIVLGLLVAVAVTRSVGPLFGAFPVLLGFGSVVWTQFTRSFGFRVASSPDGLRLRHGLLEARSQTVPPGRVQAVRLSQPLLWRGKDWWRVDVNVAGYGPAADGRNTESVLLPVGSRDEAVWMLSLVVPDLGVKLGEGARAVVDAGLVQSGGEAGFVGPPPQARWLDPLSWRRHGFRVTERAFLARRGVLSRQLDVVPHEKTQSIAVNQGWLQRRLSVASVALHSTDGPVSPTVAHLPVEVVRTLVDDQARRARTARRSEGLDRWMTKRPPAPEDA